jgi:hypothetical protein
MKFEDKSGKELTVGQTVLIPFRVTKLGGGQSPLVHLETIEAYGHENAAVGGALKGKTKNGLWAEPGQIEGGDAK